MYQQILIIGHLVKKPEVRYLDSGKAVANFSVATSETYQNRSGEQVKKTEWFNVELWDGLAKAAEKHLDKGSLVMVQGRQKTEKYQKDGVDKIAYKIRAISMKILSWKDSPADQNHDYQNKDRETTVVNPPQQSTIEDFKTDIPPNEMDDLPF